MKKLLLSATSLVLLLVSQAGLACPDYLNHSMRKLHSQESVNFCEQFSGKAMLLVNTASHCGFTPQFKGLEAIHQEYQSRGLAVVGFASNDFRQEAADEEKAAKICFVNNGVTFTMIAPSPVRGDQANPIFKALAAQSKAPSWNFNKYLINAEGEVLGHFGSRVKPQSKKLRSAIEAAL